MKYNFFLQAIGYELAFALVFYILGLWGFLLKLIVTLIIVITVPIYISHRYMIGSQPATIMPEQQEQQEQEQQDVPAELPAPEL